MHPVSMNGFSRASRLAITLAGSVLFSGCGGSGSTVEGLTPVVGKVTYKGKPLTSGVVTFVPAAGSGQNASGNIESDGSFEIKTGTTALGAHPGDYKIRIESWASPPSMGKQGKVDLGTSAIPKKYNKADSSGLKATVAKQDDEQTVDLPLND